MVWPLSQVGGRGRSGPLGAARAAPSDAVRARRLVRFGLALTLGLRARVEPGRFGPGMRGGFGC